jgi:hypothetical protein
MFPSSSEGKETSTLLVPLEIAILNHCTPEEPNRVSTSPHLKTETDPVSEALCFLVI